jgi:hypothetical protein
MPRLFLRPLFLLLAVCAQPVCADEILYRYEGDQFPAASDGWITFLGKTCTESPSGGFLTNSWPAGNGTFGGYQKVFGSSTNPPPDPPFWVEWRFASNNAIHGSYLGDGVFHHLGRGRHLCFGSAA